MTDLAGRVLEGYRIEAEIGRGGQAVVYRATQISLQRTVALKVVGRQLSADEGFLERFKREGIAAASLDHPHVIPVYEAGEAEGLAFLAMKHVDGPTLDTLIRTGSLEVRRALSILRQVAEALDYAHDKGLVHRDVKPANILLGPGDHAYLSDFGLTKALSASRLTHSGVWMGTLEYIAPEQIRGSEVTSAADRYALAVVAYEALTGGPVFSREDRTALLYAHLNDAPAPASERRPELGSLVDAVLARGLAKTPDDRHPRTVALIDDLVAAVAATPGAASVRPGPAAPTVTGPAPGGEPARVAAAPPPPAPPPATPPPPPPAPGAAPPPPPPPPPPAPTAPPQPADLGPAPPEGPPPGRRRPRWLIPAAGGGILAAIAIVVAVVLIAAGGGETNTVTTFVVTGTGAQTAPANVLPPDVPGWDVAGTEGAALGINLPADHAVETAQATRGSEVGLLVGVRPGGGAGAEDVLGATRDEIGGTRLETVPLAGAEGLVQQSGGAYLVSFAHGDRVVVAIAATQPGAVDLATAVSEAL